MALCSSPVSHILRKFDTSIIDDRARENYRNWSVCIKSYLLSQDLWEVIEASSEPKPEDSGADFKIWRKKNAAALLAIQNSCEPDILSHIREITSAKVALDTLAKLYEPEPPTVSNSSLSVINPGDLANPRRPLAAANQGSQNINKPLFEAIRKGDWDLTSIILAVKPDAIKAKITMFGQTPLHIATIAGHLKIAENLVELMSEEDLEMQDNNGRTALTDAAICGRIKVAECLIRKNKKLVTICDENGNTPLANSCNHSHKDMARYLYSVTPLEFLLSENGNHGSITLVNFIESRMFGKNSRPNL